MQSNNQQIKELEKRIKESTTTSEELTTMLKAVNNVSAEKTLKYHYISLIAMHPNHTEAIHDDILKAVKTSSDRMFRDVMLYTLAQQDSTTSNTLTKTFSIAKTLDKYHAKDMIFTALAGNPNLSENIRNEILSIAMNSSEHDHEIFIALAKNNINQIFQIVKTFEDDLCKAEVFSSLIENSNLTEEMKHDIFQETKTIKDIACKAALFSAFITKFDLTEEMQYEIFEQTQTMDFSNKARVFSSFVAKNNINETIKSYIFEQTKAFKDDGYYKAKVFIEFIKNDTLPKNNKFIELIQLIDSNHDKGLLLNEMLFSAYNANINNKEGFNNRLQAYLPIVPANVDKAFEAMQNVSNSKELTNDNKLTLMYNQPWGEIIDNIYNSQNNSNTFVNLIQTQRSQPPTITYKK